MYALVQCVKNKKVYIEIWLLERGFVYPFFDCMDDYKGEQSTNGFTDNHTYIFVLYLRLKKCFFNIMSYTVLEQ